MGERGGKGDQRRWGMGGGEEREKLKEKSDRNRTSAIDVSARMMKSVKMLSP